VTDLPHLDLYRRATAAALVIAPAALLLANLLHPEEFTRDHEAQQLAEIAGNYTRWQAAHFIALVAVVLFAAALAGLAFLVRRRSPGLGLAGGALGIAGLIALGGAVALDGFTWGILGEVWGRPRVDRATAELTLQDVQQSEWNLPFYSGAAGFVIGLVLLCVGAVRAGAVPAWSGGLLALGGLLVGLEGAVQDNAYFIVASAVWLAGGLAVAAGIAAMDDAEFAAGGPGRAPTPSPPGR
jgi:Domain of unknown function (DUF4386)